MAVTDVPDTVAPIVDRLVDATDHDDPVVVTDVLDELISAANLDDPEWLADQAAFNIYSEAIDEITERGARRWLVDVAQWWSTDHAHRQRSDIANTAQFGGVLGGAVGLIVAAFTASAYTTTSAAAGLIGAIVGVAISWMLGRWRPRSADE